jgi:HlyD family secretion protein
VEQQRVKVLVELVGEHDGLGVGYRLQARFLTGSEADALIVPRFSVLQAPDRRFYVFKVADGKLVRQDVTIGLRSDLELEVTDGLAPTDRIVARPDATMKDGMKATVSHAVASPRE